jgi:hypothetical protein
VLDELDKELEKRGLSFCRWADDCNIFVSSKRAAERVMTGISKFIEGRLKLEGQSGEEQSGAFQGGQIPWDVYSGRITYCSYQNYDKRYD